MSKYHLDLVDWIQLSTVAEMVEEGIMKRGDLEFGPLKVTVYDVTGQGTLRIDFRADEPA